MKLSAVLTLLWQADAFMLPPAGPRAAKHHAATTAAAPATAPETAVLSSSRPAPPPRYRSVRRIEKQTRLPIWPVQNGVILTILDLLGLKSLATWLEIHCGGRVCPMIMGEEAQVRNLYRTRASMHTTRLMVIFLVIHWNRLPRTHSCCWRTTTMCSTPLIHSDRLATYFYLKDSQGMCVDVHGVYTCLGLDMA